MKLPRWADTTHYQPGDVLWHGTSMRYGITDLQRPSWVSNSHAVASWFSRWHLADGNANEPMRVMKYEVVKPFTLPTFNGHNVQRMPDGGFGRMEFTEWVGFLLGHHPDDHTYGADSPVEIGEMAEDLCHAGYRGWRIVNNYDTGDDILICQPDLYLRRVQARGDRRPR